MKRIIDRHHIRSNFYMFVASAYMVMMVLWSFSFLTDSATVIIGLLLFVTDFIAEMFDPHPDKPGKWFSTHFHRVTDECPATTVKVIIILFVLLILASVIVPTAYHDDGHCGSRIISSIVDCT